MILPTITKDEIIQYLPPLPDLQIFLIGFRGYLAKDGNQRNIYDDAMFIYIRPEGRVLAYNANTDPSVARPGVAVLKPGTYFYKKGLHGVSGPHPYLALRQASNVTVIRDGGEEQTDNPDNRFWIDIHRGGYNTTSSLGCQTIHPDQWDNFRDNIFSLMDQYKEGLVPYTLVGEREH